MHASLFLSLTLLAGGCTAPPGAVTAAATLPRHYDCSRIDAAPVIDGRLDDPAWASAAWTELFEDIQGDPHPTPRFETRAKMAWDDRYLYVAAWMEEPHVNGKLDTHDQIVFHDNDFEIFIDPDGDTEKYYEIEINALGTIFDLFMVKTYLNGGPALHDWDLKGMKSAVHVEGTLNDPSDQDRYWSVEFALPWRGLAPAAGTRTPPEAGDVWRINFSRVEWKYDIVDGGYRKVPGTREDNWVWSPQGRINMHLPEHWGYLKFIEP